MHSPLRIAIFECDALLERAKCKYGRYAGRFEAFLRDSAKGSASPHMDMQISGWDVVHGKDYPDLEDIDAILISGSRSSAFEDIAWINKLVEFTKQVLAQDRVRVIGVCFGHQIVGRALGADVGRNDVGWEIAVSEVDLTEKGKELFQRDKLRIQQMHRDIVYDYPPDVIPLGSSPRCAIQGMFSPRRLITIQGHPEFNEELVTEILNTRFGMGVFTKEEFEDAMSRVNDQHDGTIVGAAFLRFLTDE